MDVGKVGGDGFAGRSGEREERLKSCFENSLSMAIRSPTVGWYCSYKAQSFHHLPVSLNVSNAEAAKDTRCTATDCHRHEVHRDIYPAPRTGN